MTDSVTPLFPEKFNDEINSNKEKPNCDDNPAPVVQNNYNQSYNQMTVNPDNNKNNYCPSETIINEPNNHFNNNQTKYNYNNIEKDEDKCNKITIILSIIFEVILLLVVIIDILLLNIYIKFINNFSILDDISIIFITIAYLYKTFAKKKYINYCIFKFGIAVWFIGIILKGFQMYYH